MEDSDIPKAVLINLFAIGDINTGYGKSFIVCMEFFIGINIVVINVLVAIVNGIFLIVAETIISHMKGTRISPTVDFTASLLYTAYNL